jgi:tetratricopeptide (TPR) repeat protein
MRSAAHGVRNAALRASAPALSKSAAIEKEKAESPSPTVSLKAWDPKTPYLESLKSASDKDAAYRAYLKEREKYGQSPAFYIDCAGWFYKAGERTVADKIISNLAEFKLEDAALWRSMGWRAREAGSYELSILALRKVLKLRGEEAQSRRDLSIVLAERGKKLMSEGNDPDAASRCVEEAMELFADAAFKVRARKSGRRGNDFQVSIVALEELNGLIAWTEAQNWAQGMKPKVPGFDAAYRRDLPVKLRIVMSWDADETDIDIHVLEPNGEEAFYGHRRTAEGGFVSEDVTTGYGPEEYLKKDLERGVYKICSNYFASHQTSLTGAATITVCVYTDWGSKEEKFKLITFRLDKPKNKLLIGEVEL